MAKWQSGMVVVVSVTYSKGVDRRDLEVVGVSKGTLSIFSKHLRRLQENFLKIRAVSTMSVTRVWSRTFRLQLWENNLSAADGALTKLHQDNCRTVFRIAFISHKNISRSSFACKTSFRYFFYNWIWWQYQIMENIFPSSNNHIVLVTWFCVGHAWGCKLILTLCSINWFISHVQ